MTLAKTNLNCLAGLDWEAMTAALAPKRRFHVVRSVLDPIPLIAMSLISGQKVCPAR